MITRENYEAFYLDFLEGTLSKEMEKAFLAFLDANPDLQISDDELPVLDEEAVSLTEFDKLLLKKSDERIIPITKQNIEYFLIAQLEGTLSEGEKLELERWLNLHPEYLKDKALYTKTVLPKENIAYLTKSDLYQQSRIIPLWARISSVAASVILLIGIGSYFTFKSVETDGFDMPQFSKQTTVPTKIKNSKSDPSKTDTPIYADYNTKNGKGVTPYAPFRVSQEKKEDNLANNVEQHKSNDNKELKENTPLTNQNGGILPDQPELAKHVTEKHNPETNQQENDYAYGLMENPIEPITNELSKRLNTIIDFRRAKEAEQSGFFIKIGKFEFLHKKGGRH